MLQDLNYIINYYHLEDILYVYVCSDMSKKYNLRIARYDYCGYSLAMLTYDHFMHALHYCFTHTKDEDFREKVGVLLG